MKAAHLIESASFFRGLSVAVRKALESVCRPQRLDKGQVLFVEAREGDAFFLLVSGGIRLHKNTPDGREVVIRVIRPGEVFADHSSLSLITLAGLVLSLSSLVLNSSVGLTPAFLSICSAWSPMFLVSE